MNARHAALAVGVASAIVMSGLSAAPPAPFAHGDIAEGRKLVEKDCVSCHAQRFGDATKMYTRADRRVSTPEQLLAQVRFCNVDLKAGYFPEEEEHVAAYLNDRFYKFMP